MAIAKPLITPTAGRNHHPQWLARLWHFFE
jgi:hypothetical protein